MIYHCCPHFDILKSSIHADVKTLNRQLLRFELTTYPIGHKNNIIGVLYIL